MGLVTDQINVLTRDPKPVKIDWSRNIQSAGAGAGASAGTGIAKFLPLELVPKRFQHW